MRWTDKPRKKTRRDVVLEYIKFMKIMGYYPTLVAYMYKFPKLSGYVSIMNRDGYRISHTSDTVCHNECMIKYFEERLHHLRQLDKWQLKEIFIDYPLNFRLPYSKACNVLDLLWSYFEEKHIANCKLVD